MKTVLLWGDAWWVDGRKIPFASISCAADVLADELGDERPALRLVFQPDDFAVAMVACPKAGRAVLAATHGADYPALATNDHAWSHEPILALGGGFTTILHYETEPRLFELVSRMQDRGFAVQSAWPLGTFLHALPEEWSESGAITVVAIEQERACAYRHSAAGQREVLMWDGAQTIPDVGSWLGAIFEKDANEPVLLIANTDAVAALDARVALAEKPGVQLLSFAEALRRPAVLPKKHPAQLLPPAPIVTPQRLAAAASIAFLASAAWSGVSYAREAFAVRADSIARDAQKHTLRTEVAHLRANAAEIATLRANLEAVRPSPPCGEFLQKLSTTLPPEIALATLQIARGRFKLYGHIAPAAAIGIIDGWRGRFADNRWTLEPQPPTASGGGFTVEGKFLS